MGVALVAFLSICSSVRSDPNDLSARGNRDDVSFARFAPPSTGVFITVSRLGDVNAALRQAHAWRLFPLLSGSATDDSIPFDLRMAVNAFLGSRSSIGIDDLMATEVGLAAESWSDVADGVWYARVKDANTLDRWFPKDRRRAARLSPSARLFRMDDGIVACARGTIVAMTRTTGGESLMRGARLLMSGRGRTALADTAGYRKLVSHLPPRPLAVAYINARSATDPGDSPTGASPERGAVPGPAADRAGGREGEDGRWWDAFDRTVVGMYEREGRIDFAMRSALKSPRSQSKLAGHAIDQMRKLPQTTLGAWASTIELNRAFEKSATTRPLGRLGRYMRLLAGFRARDGATPDPLPRLGPHVIVAWDQDMTGASAPQLAVIVECEQARLVNGEVSRIAERILELLYARDPVARENTPTIHLTTHLGVPISYVPLGPYSKESRFATAKLLRNTEPAWAAHDGWLIITLSRDHLERILDGQVGMISTLATADEAAAVWKRQTDRTMLTIVQPGLASQVLQRWLTDARAGAPSLLDPTSWNAQAAAGRSQSSRLGIAMRSADEPGVVVVVRVYPNTAAAGRLQAGDHIIGLDGESLDADAPNVDLRRRWATRVAEDMRTLRVKRGGKTIDVALRSGADRRALSDLPFSPVDAVRELASVGRAIRFASLAVHATDENHFSALLSLRFESTARRD